MRRVALLVCAIVTALIVTTGVALAAAQNEATSQEAIGEVPRQGDEPNVDYVPGEVVVRTQDGEYKTKEVNAQTLDAVEKAAEKIEVKNPSVEEASANFIYYTDKVVTNDFYFDYQEWLGDIWAPDAWDYSKGGASSGGVRIGLVDTGWQIDHPDLVKKVYDEYDFLGEDTVAEAEGNDYHGTSVAGVAAADTNNHRGVASIGFNARFVMAEACSNDCKTEDVAPAIDWLAQQKKVKIINLSFGAIYPNGTAPDPLLGDAIREAQEAGALVVAAAGNDGVYTDNHYPSCFEGVLGVGAVNEAGSDADFSNAGPCVDLVAPGQRVLTTTRKTAAFPYEYGYVTGTSFSAPQVAGTAALIRARNQGLTAEEIADRLQEQAMDKGAPGKDNLYGYGLLDAECSVNPNDSDC
jgi:subtilisin family serine protease